MADNSNLLDAIARFPVVTWAKRHMPIYDGGGDNVYGDCPYCGKKGRRKLGIHRHKKIFSCFRCREGHNQEKWRGSCQLIGAVMMFEGMNAGRAIRLIFELSGIPDEFVPSRKKEIEGMPSECVSIAESPLILPPVAELHARGLGHLQPIAKVCFDGIYRNRIVIPTNYLGEFTGFEAKGWNPDTWPKSLFPPWMDTERWVYTTQVFEPSHGIAVVTESVYDAETVAFNGIGTYGNLKDGHVARFRELVVLGIHTFCWAYDGDAWKKFVEVMHNKMLGIGKHCVIRMRQDEDPNSIGIEAIHARMTDPGMCRYVESELDLFQLTLDWGHAF